jgi:hypothetical protein
VAASAGGDEKALASTTPSKEVIAASGVVSASLFTYERVVFASGVVLTSIFTSKEVVGASSACTTDTTHNIICTTHIECTGHY